MIIDSYAAVHKRDKGQSLTVREALLNSDTNYSRKAMITYFITLLRSKQSLRVLSAYRTLVSDFYTFVMKQRIITSYWVICVTSVILCTNYLQCISHYCVLFTTILYCVLVTSMYIHFP